MYFNSFDLSQKDDLKAQTLQIYANIWISPEQDLSDTRKGKVTGRNRQQLQYRPQRVGGWVEWDESKEKNKQ